MGGGSGYAHRVQLPEGSMMAEVFAADILASMLTLSASDASVHARDSELPVPPPPNRSPPARPHGPATEPEVRSSTSVSHRCRRLGDMQLPGQFNQRAHHQVGLLLVPPQLPLLQLPHLKVPIRGFCPTCRSTTW